MSASLLLLMKRQFIITVLFLIYIEYCKSEKCKFQNACQCVFNNGSIIDLTSLGYHNKARFENLNATQKNDNFSYYYNPCFSFKLGPPSEECDKGVAVCQVDQEKIFYDCGDSEKVEWKENSGSFVLIYTGTQRTTNVSLVCSENAEEPRLNVLGELLTKNYAMVLTSRCACPDLCHTSHLSAGSVLVILLMIFVSLYLIFGIVHSSLTRGAHGWELIPHYEFWADFPLLVRDGCVFVVSGCKPETAYERI